MPKMMGGSGCPPLYNEADNTFFYMITYKGGTYRRVYGSAINEAKSCVMTMDMMQPSSAILCKRLREKQEYLHATYASSIFLAPKTMKSFGKVDFDPQPIYRALGTKALIQGIENRLVQARELITRKSAEVEIMRTERILSAIFGVENIEESNLQEKKRLSILREQFEGALRANSAVQNLIGRVADGSEQVELVKQGFLSIGSGVLNITRRDIQWICDGGKGETFTILDLTDSQDMYIREEVSMEETLRVGGIPLTPQFNNKLNKQFLTRAEIGLWQMSEEKEEWASKLVANLKKARDLSSSPLTFDDLLPIFYKGREWVNDDTLIVSKCIEDTKFETHQTVVLVTNDDRLSRNLARSAGCSVIQVKPQYIIDKFNPSDFKTDNIDVEKFKSGCEIFEFAAGLPEPKRIYLDSGSIDHALMRVEENRDVHGNKTGTYNRKTFQYSGTENGKRFSVVKLEKLENKRAFPAKVYSYNGGQSSFTPSYNWEERRKISSLSLRTKGIVRRFSRGTKGV
jgi:hypothetical protein